MGKGRDKRKKAKEESGGRNKAKQDKKQKEKNLKKQSRRAKENGSDSEDEENVEFMLQQFKDNERKKKEVVVEDCQRPSERINTSLVVNAANTTELILFGGEYWNGARTESYNDLFRYNTEKRQWKVVTSPCCPTPRSAHQSIAFKEFMVTFGGEFTSPSQSQFYHHKDLWRLNTNTWQWEEIKHREKGSPQPRSGHRMTLWKRTVLMFGGFHDTLTSTGAYFDDLWALDNVDLSPSWRRIDYHGESPSKRSAVCLSVYGDTLFLYGGYSVASKATEGVTHTDLYQLNLATCTWTKVKKVGIPPTVRSGMTVCMSARKAIFFGGVMDYDDGGGKKKNVKSRFFNDLFVFNMDNRRWFPLVLKKKAEKKITAPTRGASKKKRGKRGGCDSDDDDNLEQNLKNLSAAAAGAPAAAAAAAAAPSPASPVGDDDESSSEEEDEAFQKGLIWDPSSMPQLSQAKRKVKRVSEKQARRKPGSNPSKDAGADAAAAAAAKAKKTGYEINSKEPGGAVDSDGEDAPQGIPIMLGNQVIGYSPVDAAPAPAPVAAAPKAVDGSFSAAEAFEGSRKGFVFQQGEQGLGYYANVPPTVDEDFLLRLAEEKRVSFAEAVKERSKMTHTVNENGQAVPCGRFGSQMCCSGNYMYLYGGQFEEAAREVTLCDLYRLNLNTLDTFEPLEEMDLAQQDWYESSESSSEDADGGDEGVSKAPRRGSKKGKSRRKKRDGDVDDEASEDEEEEESEEDESGDDESGDEEAAAAKKTAVKGRIRNKREHLRQQLGADEGVPTPEPHEELKAFSARTKEYWVGEVKAQQYRPSDKTAADEEKAFRKDAFRFAAVRFYEVCGPPPPNFLPPPSCQATPTTPTSPSAQHSTVSPHSRADRTHGRGGEEGGRLAGQEGACVQGGGA